MKLKKLYFFFILIILISVPIDHFKLKLHEINQSLS